MNPDQYRHVVLDPDGHKVVELPTGGRVVVPYDPLYEAERVAAEAARAMDPPDELRCRYKSMRCNHLRAQKRSGDLHNLCQMHRERANHNQRNSELRKRTGKSLPRSRPVASRATGMAFYLEDSSGPTALNVPRLLIPEPLQGTDGLQLAPTYDELNETAMLLSLDRDRE